MIECLLLKACVRVLDNMRKRKLASTTTKLTTCVDWCCFFGVVHLLARGRLSSPTWHSQLVRPSAVPLVQEHVIMRMHSRPTHWCQLLMKVPEDMWLNGVAGISPQLTPCTRVFAARRSPVPSYRRAGQRKP